MTYKIIVSKGNFESTEKALYGVAIPWTGSCFVGCSVGEALDTKEIV